MLRRRSEKSRRRRLRRDVKWTVIAVVAILVLEIFVLPRLGGLHQSLRLLSHVNVWVALTGLVLEAAALVAWAMLTYTVLPPGILLRRRIMQIDLSTLAVSHIMPGGTAFGAALMYRLLTQRQVRPSDAGFAIAMQGVGSAVVLNVIFLADGAGSASALARIRATPSTCKLLSIISSSCSMSSRLVRDDLTSMQG